MKPKAKAPKLQDNPNFRYVYHERIGMLCEDREPTPQQRAQAFGIARDYCDSLLSPLFFPAIQ